MFLIVPRLWMLWAECLLGLLSSAESCRKQRLLAAKAKVGRCGMERRRAPIHPRERGKPWCWQTFAEARDLVLVFTSAPRLVPYALGMLFLYCALGMAVLMAGLDHCKETGAGGWVWAGNGSIIQQRLLWDLHPAFTQPSSHLHPLFLGVQS